MAKTPVEVKTVTPARAPHPWQSLRDEIDRLFDRFTGGFGLPAFRRMFDTEPAWPPESSFSFAAPAVDVIEDDKAYKITAEVPGLEEKNIEVALGDDRLTVRGEKTYENEDKSKSRYMSERAYGSFERSFMLPAGIDRGKIAADLAKGVLTITLPKTAQAQKQQKIEIKAAA